MDVARLNAVRVLARSYRDVQELRIALDNRVHALERSGALESRELEEPLEHLQALEQSTDRLLKKVFRRAAPELNTWARETTGIGVHSLALLIGEIGHPVIASPQRWEEGTGADKKVLVNDGQYIRSVSQLWSYCGVGDPARRKTKGMPQEATLALGKMGARTLLYTMAVGALTNRQYGGPYVEAYDLARQKYDTREGWPNARRHNAALRYVSKMILKDVYSIVHASMVEEAEEEYAAWA